MGNSIANETCGEQQSVRVLDLDLDFFVEGVAHDRLSDGPRLDGGEYPPWTRDRAFEFLEARCGLTDPLPGIVVEHHGELFRRWRDLIAEGRLPTPFEVTHIDAHGDLGWGETAHVYLTTELLYEPPESRLRPKEGPGGLDDGSYLAFAVACRWISRLTYVYNHGGGSDVFPFFKQALDPTAEMIQLPAMSRPELDKAIRIRERQQQPKVDRLEPPVPFREIKWPSFNAPAGFDMICLARSPGFTPVEADELFGEIRARFVDEDVLR